MIQLFEATCEVFYINKIAVLIEIVLLKACMPSNGGDRIYFTFFF